VSGDHSFRTGIRDGAVLFFAIGVFGIAFGALAIESGFSPWLAVLTSMIVVSGAAQFTMIGLLGTGAAPILIATTGLALRHIPMSVRLAQLIGPRPLPVRAGLGWVLVDETFGLTLDADQRGVSDLVAYKFGADLMLFSGWVLGTAAGTVVGRAIDPEELGVSILFPLLFIGLAAPLIKRRADWLVVALAIGLGLVAVDVLPEAWQITATAAAAAAIGAWVE
jgi:predicted branched-subunit amino acid permease